MNPVIIIYSVVGLLLLASLIMLRRPILVGIKHGVPAIYNIAGITFAEARRRRILQVIIMLAAVMLLGMLSITWLSPGESHKAIISGGLDMMFLFGTLVSIFICAFMIPTDIDKRTIYPVLSKPISRWEFVIGKYFGALGVVGLLMLVMLVVQLVVLTFISKSPITQVLLVGLLAYFGIAVFTALVLAISTVASNLTTVIAGFVFWMVGSMESMSHSFISHTDGASKILLSSVSWIVPHLNKYDFRVEAAENMVINPAVIQGAVTYGLVYIAACLIIGSVLFNERQV